MKFFLTILFTAALLYSYAQRPVYKRDPGMRNYPHKHPLISVLESDLFTPAERTRLKDLAEKDRKAFALEMRKHFRMHRKAEAEKILSLRKQVIEAKDPAVRKKAEDELKVLIRKKADQRLAFHKKILDETVRNIQYMQRRCDMLRKEYDNRKNNKEQLVEKELEKILSAEPPAYLKRNAAWDPSKPLPPPPPMMRKNKK